MDPQIHVEPTIPPPAPIFQQPIAEQTSTSKIKPILIVIGMMVLLATTIGGIYFILLQDQPSKNNLQTQDVLLEQIQDTIQPTQTITNTPPKEANDTMSRFQLELPNAWKTYAHSQASQLITDTQGYYGKLPHFPHPETNNTSEYLAFENKEFIYTEAIPQLTGNSRIYGDIYIVHPSISKIDPYSKLNEENFYDLSLWPKSNLKDFEKLPEHLRCGPGWVVNDTKEIQLGTLRAIMKSGHPLCNYEGSLETNIVESYNLLLEKTKTILIIRVYYNSSEPGIVAGIETLREALGSIDVANN